MPGVCLEFPTHLLSKSGLMLFGLLSLQLPAHVLPVSLLFLESRPKSRLLFLANLPFPVFR